MLCHYNLHAVQFTKQFRMPQDMQFKNFVFPLFSLSELREGGIIHQQRSGTVGIAPAFLSHHLVAACVHTNLLTS